MRARCYEGEEALPFAPIIQLLRATLALDAASNRLSAGDRAELARLLPELEPAGNGHEPSGQGAQTRFLDAIARVLLSAGRERATIYVLDDLQWADDASLEFLSYMLRRLDDQRIGILLAWRPEGFSGGQMLKRALAGKMKAAEATSLQLKRLDAGDVRRLVEAVQMDRAMPAGEEDIASWLYSETEGLPFFLAEYLDAMARGSEGRLPAGVQELLLSRLSATSELGRQFLSAAAVLGRSFAFDALKDAGGRDEEMTVAALEELCSQGLLREVATQDRMAIYDFSHDKLRELVYEGTSLARRLLLHRRVAASLALRVRTVPDESLTAQVGHHYHSGGMTAEAAEYYRRAADYARSVFAVREALSHYQSALALGSVRVPELHEAQGDLLAVLGEYRSAAAEYEASEAAGGEVQRSRIEHKLGTVYHRWGDWEMAEKCYAEALSASDGTNTFERAGIYADWSMAAFHRSDPERAAELAGEAMRLATEEDDRRALAQAHVMLGVLASSAGRAHEAREHLDEALELAKQVEDSALEAAVLQNLAALSFSAGDLDEAGRLTAESLALVEKQGDRHREAALHNAIADVLHARGDETEALIHVKKAVGIYSEIGVDAGSVRPEVWKLTEW